MRKFWGESTEEVETGESLVSEEFKVFGIKVLLPLIRSRENLWNLGLYLEKMRKNEEKYELFCFIFIFLIKNMNFNE